MNEGISGIKILNFKKRPSGALVGFCDLAIWGAVIKNCKLFYKTETQQAWLGPPSEKKEGKDGQPVYTDLVDFTSALQRHISEAVREDILRLAGAGPAPRQEQLPPSSGSAPSGTASRPAANRQDFRRSGEAGVDAAYRQTRAAATDPLGKDIPY